MDRFPKRLIEVDLPIKRISAHARREKSIRHGHISTLHIWWARRPLAACRAVICASLWPDPADKHCPELFRETARAQISDWAERNLGLLSQESYPRFNAFRKNPKKLLDHTELQKALLDFIADFANWDNSTNPAYLATARALTQAAHEALGGAPGTRPLVVDPFAGGGAIPLEALRVGADAFASDLNPVAVLLNKVVLEYIPKYGHRLADEVDKWGKGIREQAEQELAEFYPKDSDGSTPIAYLWARTVRCEGPGCGAEVPLIRSLWLAKKGKNSVALRLVPRPRAKRADFEIIEKAKVSEVGEGTVQRGSVSCPCCGYTTPVESVRAQLSKRRGGADDARLLCVITARSSQPGRTYRLPTERDLQAANKAAVELKKREKAHKGKMRLVPDESISPNELRRISVPLYGMNTWGDLFSSRQALTLSVLADKAQAVRAEDKAFTQALRSCLALCVSRQADALSSLCRWHTTRELSTGAFGRQALGMVWDFSEVNPFGGASGGFEGAVEWVTRVCRAEGSVENPSGQVVRASATAHPLSDDMADAVITDPPYYDSVPYAHLSDYWGIHFAGAPTTPCGWMVSAPERS